VWVVFVQPDVDRKGKARKDRKLPQSICCSRKKHDAPPERPSFRERSLTDERALFIAAHLPSFSDGGLGKLGGKAIRHKGNKATRQARHEGTKTPRPQLPRHQGYLAVPKWLSVPAGAEISRLIGTSTASNIFRNLPCLPPLPPQKPPTSNLQQ
jgi:hypothetical protein